MDKWTLTEAANLLGVPQHRLIHLCEKKVVIPDVRDARGRGSSRQFSRRNLFDFAVALEMRKLELPVSYVHAVLKVLRAFELEAKVLLGNFTLPDSLLAPNAPQLSLVILDGERLFFSLARAGKSPRVFGGVNIHPRRTRGRAGHHQNIGQLRSEQAEQTLSGGRTKTQIDLSRIARDFGDRLQDV